MATRARAVGLDKSPTELIKKYRDTGDIEIRNEIVMRYSYIAKTVATQMRGITSGYADVEDIVNQGIIALIDCVERFEPEKEVKFETYAFLRVRGAVIDFIRKQDWRPRRLKKTAREVSAAYDELSNVLMREPSSKEMSEYLNISEEELHRHYMEISRSNVLSFEALLENALQTEILSPDEEDGSLPEQTMFRQELEKELAKAIDSLSERERLVISLYYYENLKLAEISTVLGVSESRVCQIHSKAIEKMKKTLEDYMKG